MRDAALNRTRDSVEGLVYGVLELGVALATSYTAMSPRLGLDIGLKMMAAIYIVVRAFDNISEGRKQRGTRSRAQAEGSSPSVEAAAR